MIDVETELELPDPEATDAEAVTVLDLTGTAPAGTVAGRESFEDLYRRLFDPLRRLAYVLVDTEEQAAEVVQEAFAKLYPRMERVHAPEAYVRTTVLNLGRRTLRRRGLARERVRPEPEAPASPHDHVLDAVRRLPRAQRSVIVLRYYLQLTDEEIASTLQMRPGTVKSSLHRARQQLREVLQP